MQNGYIGESLAVSEKYFAEKSEFSETFQLIHIFQLRSQLASAFSRANGFMSPQIVYKHFLRTDVCDCGKESLAIENIYK
jgi:hypothetical protein